MYNPNWSGSWEEQACREIIGLTWVIGRLKGHEPTQNVNFPEIFQKYTKISGFFVSSNSWHPFGSCKDSWNISCRCGAILTVPAEFHLITWCSGCWGNTWMHYICRPGDFKKQQALISWALVPFHKNYFEVKTICTNVKHSRSTINNLPSSHQLAFFQQRVLDRGHLSK